jgi:hypothetical protein
MLCRYEQIGCISRARLPLAWLMQPGYREKPTKQTEVRDNFFETFSNFYHRLYV